MSLAKGGKKCFHRYERVFFLHNRFKNDVTWEKGIEIEKNSIVG